MNKNDLINHIQGFLKEKDVMVYSSNSYKLKYGYHNQVTKVICQELVDDIFNVMLQVVAVGGEVRTPLGILRKVTKKPHIGRNPKTGERVEVPEKHTIKLVPSNMVKDLLN